MNIEINNKRNLSLDIFRFICMYLITACHLGYTNLGSLIQNEPINLYILILINSLKLIGINGFIMISAYFLCESKFTHKRIINFWTQLLIYSIVIFCIMTALNGFSTKNCIKSFFPILSQHYWYPVNYLILLTIFPFINKLIFSLSKKELLNLLLIMFIIQSVLLSANPFYDCAVYFGHSSHSILWWIFLYCIAAYIKIYGVKFKTIYFICIFFVSLLLSILSLTVNLNLPTNIQIGENNGILALLMTVSSFVIFLKLDNKYVNSSKLKQFMHIVTPALFCVYIIQEHNCVRYVFWKNIEKMYTFCHNPFLILSFAFFALLVGALILYYIYLFIKKILVDRLTESILSKIDL